MATGVSSGLAYEENNENENYVTHKLDTITAHVHKQTR